MHDGILSLSCIRAQEEAEFREFAARPNVLDLIPKRIAPQIFGSERIKEAVACLLFGGSRKVCNPFSRNTPLLNQHKLQPSHAPLLESLQHFI
jgi:DNA replicative helicase MCM subunit Mcm2 (Cdc46/Mcm family)